MLAELVSGEALSSARRGCCVLTVSARGLFAACVSLLVRTLVSSDQGPTSLNLKYLFCLISKYSKSPGYSRVPF